MERSGQISSNGRVGLVTGGASDIGYAIADRLVRFSASVLLLDIEGTKAEAAAQKLANVISCEATA